MWQQFIFENIHFAIGLTSALVVFAMAWLYFDAWKERKNWKEGLRTFGLVVLSLSYVIQAASIETNVLKVSLFAGGENIYWYQGLKLLGLVLLIFSLLIDPLQPRPKGMMAVVGLWGVEWLRGDMIGFLFPVLMGIVSLLYLRRASVGLERHIKGPAIAFGLISMSEVLALSSYFRNTDDVVWFKRLAPFGPVWTAEQLVLAVGIVILARWVFSYLLRRFETQLFMVFNLLLLFIFLVVTIGFTGLLLRNMEKQVMIELESQVRVVDYAVGSKRVELLADAQVVAENGEVKKALGEDGDPSGLRDIVERSLIEKKLGILVVIDETGKVVARGEERERVGESISGDGLVKKVLVGGKDTTIEVKDGVIAPTVMIKAGLPIKDGDKIIGAVVSGVFLDNAFVDGVNKKTGLEATIYGNDQVSATTFWVDDKSRPIGFRENRKDVKDIVLMKGESWSGSMNWLNQPFLMAMMPLKNVDGNPVGILSVARSQIEVLRMAGKSIEMTFVMTAVMMMVMMLPAYLVAKSITNQVK